MAGSLHRSGAWERLPGSAYRKGRGSDEAGVRGSALLPILFSTRARADRADGQPSRNHQQFMEPMVAWRRTARRAIYECEPVNRCQEIVGVGSPLSRPISTTRFRDWVATSAPRAIEPKQAQAEIEACKVVWKKSAPIWTNLILPYLQLTIASFVTTMSSFIQLVSEGLESLSEMTVY